MNWNKITDVSSKIAEIAKVKSDRVFIDVSGISSVPLAPNKQEMRSILLVGEEEALKTPVSQLPLINSISGHLDMLRVYTDEENRKKVTIAALERYLETKDQFVMVSDMSNRRKGYSRNKIKWEFIQPRHYSIHSQKLR